MIEADHPCEAEQVDDQQFILSVYEEYRSLMYRVAGNLTDTPDKRDDLMQETLAKLIPKAGRIRDFSCCSLGSYIVRIIRNTSYSHYQRSALESKYFVDQDLSEFSDDEFDIWQNGGYRPVEDAALLRVQAAELKAVLDKLPEKEQILLRGKYQLNLSDKELAKQLQCSPGSIRMMLTRARRHALALSEKEGLQYETT